MTSRQRSDLRSVAHSLDPVVLVGRVGVTGAVVREIDDALEARELIKVRLSGDRGERAEVVGQIGRALILYRENPDPSRRRIELSPP
ncbi:MAG TPA: YhbY family RNA-binding protein [Gemmatimonadota bacterium]|nr:YhbY family RNA-binding protein [Gemmatimonadota bacterium]